MSEQKAGKRIPSDDLVAVELRLAVHAGDVAAIQTLLRNDPALASARLVGKDGGTGTPLHLVTDWPGYFPNGPQIVRLLVDAGADLNALTSGRDSPGPGDETPLHYAASSDDADVAEALIGIWLCDAVRCSVGVGGGEAFCLAALKRSCAATRQRRMSQAF